MSFDGDQLRQVVLGGGFDFAAILAQLRRNPVELERAVDLVLGLAGDALVVVQTGQAVLAQREPIFNARWRSVTLWFFEPVKYCMAAP